MAIFGSGALAVLAAVAWTRADRGQGAGDAEARCGAGFVSRGVRCCRGDDAEARGDVCIVHACPAPFVESGAGEARACDAPDVRVAIPRTELLVGPSDWEAEGRVAPRTVHAGPFDIDAFEVTMGKLRCPSCLYPSASYAPSDAARAASGVTFAEGLRYCASRGGRLPTDDEWLVAASGPRGSRYPWGDTGAVCRRAAFGLASGPCASGARGPDTVGAHPLGDTDAGLHDLAGNVAEWVVADRPVVRGGSYATSLATELRTWAKEEVSSLELRDARVGFRCVYDRTSSGGAP